VCRVPDFFVTRQKKAILLNYFYFSLRHRTRCSESGAVVYNGTSAKESSATSAHFGADLATMKSIVFLVAFSALIAAGEF
jgi:hypothetical protein